MDTNQKIPFLKRMVMSIKDLDKYNKIIAEKITRGILYLFLLMIIFSIILSAALTYKTSLLIKDACIYIKNETPYFKIDEHGLYVEGDNELIIDDLNSILLKIIIDDNAENADKYKEMVNNYNGSSILALKNNIILFTNGRELSISYEQFMRENNIESISKDNLLKLFDDNKVNIYSGIYISMYGVVYVMYTLSTFIDALVLSLLALIVGKMLRIRLSYTQDLNIAISALTLPIILNLIYTCANILWNFQMPYFQIMYTIISYIYIIAAILIMRSEMIKQKQMIKATIEIRNLEKQQEENKDKENEGDKEEKNKKKKQDDGILDKAKDKVKGKVSDKEKGLKPEANIEGGK